ncbi:unnamed protein product [Didymodactylos carnosus]|uniref:Fungal lipase-type domain-containing protein n=1 Tax=Didymodactylos carnosus TaxID=1234261 RepID=A0A815EFS0_9BILA|nr:unnamed protein product [Didymodactylos carnosus]CAF1310813.1 unnamed protein product [Didymodactylos carnosus]CAF3719939.1 unnamed protein product [Didymodactylos carnosus]CAF4148017.1 unnamed protein product [Didymodactylos carnosus]
MLSIQSLLIPRLLSSIVIRFRSIGLIIFNFLLNIFVNRFTILYPLIKFIGQYIQLFLGIITGNHSSLVNISDGDFSIGTNAYQLFNQKNNNKDYNNPDIHDIFHIYLSKILYESSDRIKEQCIDWGFNEELIEILTYESTDVKKYLYSTEAAVINHDESNTIIIAFRGTEPMDLLEWMTDVSTNFIDIDNVFNDMNNNNSNDNKIRVHAGFYFALGLDAFDPSQPIDFSKVTKKTPMFIQLLKYIQKFDHDGNKCNISITGHSLGAGLASLFSFVLLAYGYESSISAVYTYGQPLVGNRRYAEILNNKLGNRIHRWVNHSDVVTRIPVIELPSIAWYYARTLYSDALEGATNNNQTKSNPSYKLYYHSGLRFKIDRKGNLIRQNLIDEGPILACEDRFDLFHFIYSIGNVIDSLFNITPLRSFLWLTGPVEINDHFPGDYARKIKKIVTKK